MLSGDSLDAQIEDWNSCLSKAINEIAPQHPLCSRSKLSPLVYHGTQGDEKGAETTRLSAVMNSQLKGNNI